LIFAKIDYINLLPFHVFTKRYIKSSQIKGIINYKKSYPSKINDDFLQRKVDAAFISSIKSSSANRLDIGIVAKAEVLSVLVSKDSEYKEDYESSTSNVLAKVLGFSGEVIIGDKALKEYIKGEKEYIDLAKEWTDRYNLPFVFAVLCVNSNKKYLKKLSKEFLKSKTKIPRYILKQYEKKTSISADNILHYLTKISYDIGYKEKRALQKFIKLSKGV
jgi:chorismate dehydratase